MRKDKQKNALAAHGGAAASMDDDIRKYEEIGTHPAANHNAIAVALAFHRAIGAERKIARLRYLRDRWAKRLLAASDRVKVLTPLDSPTAPRSGSSPSTGSTRQAQAWLLNQHRIVTTPIVHPEFSGLRITPNVYTTTAEIDTFTTQVLTAMRTGLT